MNKNIREQKERKEKEKTKSIRSKNKIEVFQKYFTFVEVNVKCLRKQLKRKPSS